MSVVDAQDDWLMDQHFDDAFIQTFGIDTSLPESTHLQDLQAGYAGIYDDLQPFAEQIGSEERPVWADLRPFEFNEWINSAEMVSVEEDETPTSSLNHQEQPQPLELETAASSEQVDGHMSSMQQSEALTPSQNHQGQLQPWETQSESSSEQTDDHGSQDGEGTTMPKKGGPWPGEHSHDRLFDLPDHQPNFKEGNFGILDFGDGNVKSDIPAHFQQQPLEDESSSLPPGSFPFEHPDYNGPITPDFVSQPKEGVNTNAFSGSSQVGHNDARSSIAPLPQSAHKLKYVHTCDPEDATLAVHFIIGHTTSKTGVFRMNFTQKIDVPRSSGVKERLWRCPRSDCKICKASRTGSHIGEKIAKDLGVEDAFSGKSRKRKVQQVEHEDAHSEANGAKRQMLEETSTSSTGQPVSTLPLAQAPAPMQPIETDFHPPAFMTPPTTTSEARLSSSPAAYNTDHSASD
ncbi:hypothetical protein KC340_g13473 [Hortaea werneckii]|nr:hypothetical protein KC342_g12834 [Hortaea werneckii]KAI7300137.1 hypothetical protein KC340_g13473 [Hortaea werneckii]KAI7377417.1 hypothetical protein KC328_g14439 [Hortaea werneckii]